MISGWEGAHPAGSHGTCLLRTLLPASLPRPGDSTSPWLYLPTCPRVLDRQIHPVGQLPGSPRPDSRGAVGGWLAENKPCRPPPWRSPSPCLLPPGVRLWPPTASSPTPRREPSELQGLGALEATALALKLAERELGLQPVVSAQAVVAGSDPLGLIAYLSHFHSAFKSMPHNPGDLEGSLGPGWDGEVCEGQGRGHPLGDTWGRDFWAGVQLSVQAVQSWSPVHADAPPLPAGSVSPGCPGTPSAVLFLGKLQRTLQRTRGQVESRARAGAGRGSLG